jgi:uncharacterized protein
MQCPRCEDHPIHEHPIEDWRPLVCDRCGGLWLDGGSFRDAVRRPPPNGTDPGATKTKAVWEESPLPCPACRVPMKKTNYSYSSGVFIDRCHGCGGVWLDRGELAKLRAFVNRPVPQDKVLLAQLQAESIRERFEAQERREGGTRGSPAEADGIWIGLRELISWLRQVL